MTIGPIGLAKDGRVIYKPFKGVDEFWDTCDIDVCGGQWV
jgi:hypothetical protein